MAKRMLQLCTFSFLDILTAQFPCKQVKEESSIDDRQESDDRAASQEISYKDSNNSMTATISAIVINGLFRKPSSCSLLFLTSLSVSLLESLLIISSFTDWD